jgi:hypothetical protein
MAYQQKPGQTNLFSNRDKTSDKHPDFKGECQLEINGRLYPLDIAMWRKESDRAGEYFSVSIRLKSQQQTRPNTGRQHFNQRITELGTPIDDDIDRAFAAPPVDEKDIPWAVPYDVSPERRFRI